MRQSDQVDNTTLVPRGVKVRVKGWIICSTFTQESGVHGQCETKHQQSFPKNNQVVFMPELNKKYCFTLTIWHWYVNVQAQLIAVKHNSFIYS